LAVNSTPVLVLVAASGATTAVKNVAEYVCDGTADQTEITNALNDVATSGGLVQLTPGTFNIAAPITVPISTGIQLRGSGWGTILQAGTGIADYVIKFSTTSGNVSGATLAEFKVDGNGGSGGAGAGSGGIYAKGAVQCLFDHLWVTNAYDAGLWLHEISSGVFGHHNRVTNCLFDRTVTITTGFGQGIRMQSSDENWIANCDFESLGGTGSEPYAIKDWSGINFIDHCCFVSGEEGIRFQDTNGSRVTNPMFDGVGRDCIHCSGSQITVMGGTFSGGGQSTAGTYSHISCDNATDCQFIGGTHTTDATAGRLRSFYREQGTSARNVIADKALVVNGALGTGKIELLSTSTAKVHHVSGYNPVGNVTAPSVPASGVNATNNTGVDVAVFIVGGTVSAISVGGTTTGLTTTPANVRVPAGQTVSVTYSVAPTWKWFGD
jgi:Right handed beta helix region